jgi:hypothetical protein
MFDGTNAARMVLRSFDYAVRGSAYRRHRYRE